MPASTVNPDLLQQRLAWHNRVQTWRARPGESVFTAAAGLAFCGFGLWVAEPLWPALLRADAPWSRPAVAAALTLATTALLLLRARAASRSMVRAQLQDWLAAQPIPAGTRRHARRLHASAAAWLAAVAIVALLGWAWLRSDAPPALAGTLAAGALLGALLSWWLPQGSVAPTTVARLPALAVAIPPDTRGLALLGAALEPAVARLPRGAPWVAACFMLLPPSTPALAIPALMLLFTAVSMSFDLVGHWRARYLADQAWLAALPLPARRLFAAYLPTLARRGLLLALVVGGCLHLLGAPAPFAWLLALALALALIDALLCGFATRREPARFPLWLMLHATLLVACTQVLPPALPLVYAACAWSAWRRGLA